MPALRGTCDIINDVWQSTQSALVAFFAATPPLLLGRLTATTLSAPGRRLGRLVFARLA